MLVQKKNLLEATKLRQTVCVEKQENGSTTKRLHTLCLPFDSDPSSGAGITLVVSQ